MKNQLLKIAACCSAVLAFTTSVQAQPGLNVEISQQGVSLIGKSYKDVKGSPLLYDFWTRAEVTFTDGTLATNQYIKYDQISGLVYYKTKDNKEQKFEKPVRQFVIKDLINNEEISRIFRNGFSRVDEDTNPTTYFEVIADGKIKLIKYLVKKIVEERGAGSINVSKQIQQTSRYYIGDTSFTRVKKDKKAILELLPDHQKEINSFIATEKISFKSEEDLSRLITYYNSLP